MAHLVNVYWDIKWGRVLESAIETRDWPTVYGSIDSPWLACITGARGAGAALKSLQIRSSLDYYASITPYKFAGLLITRAGWWRVAMKLGVIKVLPRLAELLLTDHTVAILEYRYFFAVASFAS